MGLSAKIWHNGLKDQKSKWTQERRDPGRENLSDSKIEPHS